MMMKNFRIGDWFSKKLAGSRQGERGASADNSIDDSIEARRQTNARDPQRRQSRFENDKEEPKQNSR